MAKQRGFFYKMGHIPSFKVETTIMARCSSENSDANAWNLNLNDGNLNTWNNKSQNKNHVRPVSALSRRSLFQLKYKKDGTT